MSSTAAAAIFIASIVLALALAYKPVGDYMYRVFTPTRHSRLERGIYRLIGVDPAGEQSWPVYARSVLAFSAVSVLFLYLFQRVQSHLLLSLGFADVPPALSWNTAVSFVTNTNWQAYSGESTMGHLVQMAGLAVQNFASAAVGIVVAIALVRGFARKLTDHLGNFWVDLVRAVLRILLPVAVIGAIVFVAAGMVQNFSAGTDVHTLAGATQHLTGGPVASQEIIKEFGTNGGGFYNVNSAHPFENPTAWTNWLQIFPAAGDLDQPAADVRPDGRQQQAGLRHRRRHVDHGDRQRDRAQRAAGHARRHGSAGGRFGGGGHRHPVRACCSRPPSPAPPR